MVSKEKQETILRTTNFNSTMKKLFKKLHLWLSLPLGILISIVCFSGASLVFEQEITQALNPHLYKVKHSEQSLPLHPSELAKRIHEQLPDSLQVISLQLSQNHEDVCLALFRGMGKKMMSIHPYTGEINGWIPAYPFFQTMRKLHRWLMNPPAAKGETSAGKIIVGITTLFMVLILISGLILWLPRNRNALKRKLYISLASWKRFWYDSHVVLGFYSTVFLLLMALTGLTWSFGWYRTLAYNLFSGKETTAANAVYAHKSTTKGQPGKQNAPTGKVFDYKIWDKVWNSLQKEYEHFETITLTTNNAQIIPFTTHIKKPDTAIFNPQSGEITKIIGYEDTPRSKTLKGWFYALHTGSWGGIITKILYFIAACIGGVLPISGYYLWWKRTHKTKRLS